MRYRIKCLIFGGITGRRQGWLKENGIIFETDNLKEASDRANKLNQEMNNEFSTANFLYQVIQIEEPLISTAKNQSEAQNQKIQL